MSFWHSFTHHFITKPFEYMKTSLGIDVAEHVVRGDWKYMFSFQAIKDFGQAQLDAMAMPFRFVDDLWPQYEEFDGTQIISLADDPYTSNSLLTSVYNSCINNTDIQDALRSLSINGFALKATQYHRRSRRSNLYSEFEATKNVRETKTRIDKTDIDSLEIAIAEYVGLPVWFEGTEADKSFIMVDCDYGEYIQRSRGIEILKTKYAYNEETGKLTFKGKEYGLTDITSIGGELSAQIVNIQTKEAETILLGAQGTSIGFICNYMEVDRYNSTYELKDVSMGLSDASTPTLVIKLYNNTYKSTQEKYSGYLMPLRIRSDFKPIKQDTDEFKENRRLANIFGIDFIDIAKSVNADAEYVKKTYKKKDTKEQEEADAQYLANLAMVDNAFLVYGVDISDTDQAACEYIYKYFKYLHSTNSTGEHLKYKEFNYHLSFDFINITKTTDTENKYKVGYSKAIEEREISTGNTSSGGGFLKPLQKIKIKELTLVHKNREGKCTIITVSGLHSSNYNHGWREVYVEEAIRANEDDNAQNMLIPLHTAVLRKIGAFRADKIMRASLKVIMNTYTKVRKKWYASTWFTVFRIIVSVAIIIVVTYLSFGTMTWQTISLIMLIDALINIAIQIAVNIAIALLIKYAVKVVCRILNVDPQWEALISLAVQLVYAYYSADINGALGLSSQIGQIVGAATTAYQIANSFKGNREEIANSLTGTAIAMAGSYGIGSIGNNKATTGPMENLSQDVNGNGTFDYNNMVSAYRDNGYGTGSAVQLNNPQTNNKIDFSSYIGNGIQLGIQAYNTIQGAKLTQQQEGLLSLREDLKKAKTTLDEAIERNNTEFNRNSQLVTDMLIHKGNLSISQMLEYAINVPLNIEMVYQEIHHGTEARLNCHLMSSNIFTVKLQASYFNS